VNPGHLFAGTASDNTQDMIRKGRQGGWRPRKDFCPRGHPNKRYPNGNTKCLTCERRWAAERWRKQKGAV
jgi:hypothetical protein